MDVLTGLSKFFELLNDNSGGLTFLITVVYVVATIAILHSKHSICECFQETAGRNAKTICRGKQATY